MFVISQTADPETICFFVYFENSLEFSLGDAYLLNQICICRRKPSKVPVQLAVYLA